ncbi:MAG: FkbM family methyltransferase [Sphingomonadaceae bacterium]
MTAPNFATRLRGSIRRNLEHVRMFGPSVLLRHFRSKQPIEAVTLKGFGQIHVRIDGSDVSTFKQVFLDAEYDLAGLGCAIDRVETRYRAIIASGKVPVIVDAGANVGAAALWFSRRFPESAVVAIEPEPGNAEVLRRNVQGRPRITVIEAAIASAPGKISISDGSTGWDVQTQRSDQGAIAAIAIDDAIAVVPNGAPFIAKIDIEGFESDLFAANIGWVDTMAIVLIEPHDWMMPGQFSSRHFQAVMGTRGYEMFINGENLIYVAP